MVKLVKRKYQKYFAKCAQCDALLEFDPEDVADAEIVEYSGQIRICNLCQEVCAVNGECPKCGYYHQISPVSSTKYFFVKLFANVGEVKING